MEAGITKVPLNTIVNIVSPKLQEHNFLTCKALLPPLFKRYNILGYIDGPKPCPNQFVYAPRTTDLEATIYPEWICWNEEDQTLIQWIKSSISESVISYICWSNNILSASEID